MQRIYKYLLDFYKRYIVDALRLFRLNISLKAGALYYAIFIAFIIALVCISIMLNTYLHHTFIVQYLQTERMERNIQSALILNNEDPSLVNLNETKEIDLFNDEGDIVTIHKYPWGVFDLVQFTATWNKTVKSKIALTGTDLAESKPVALYLADQQRYLSVSGQSLLRGDCYLPQLGIRRAYIEGKSFIGKDLVEGKIEKSGSNLPEIDIARATTQIQLMNGISPSSDSIFSYLAIISKPVMQHSFFNNTHTFYSNEWITLHNQTIEGNIRIVSKKGITLDGSVSLNNMIIYAPKVEIKKGFKGSVQVFATDTILVGEHCTFLSPSALVLLSSIEKPFIEISSETLFKGDVYLTTTNKGMQAIPEIKVGANSRIEGQLYINGKIELHGNIYGSLYCNGFILRTPSALYENHLLDVVIDYTSLSKNYSGFMLFPKNTKTKKLRWVD
jgi:hypothetical protein